MENNQDNHKYDSQRDSPPPSLRMEHPTPSCRMDLAQFCLFIEARSNHTPRECVREVQLEPLKPQTKPSDAPKDNEMNEQSSDDENTPRPSARFSQRRGKIVFAGGEV